MWLLLILCCLSTSSGFFISGECQIDQTSASRRAKNFLYFSLLLLQAHYLLFLSLSIAPFCSEVQFPPLWVQPLIYSLLTLRRHFYLSPFTLYPLNFMSETSSTFRHVHFLFILITSFCWGFSFPSHLWRQSIGRNLVSYQLCAIGYSSQRKKGEPRYLPVGAASHLAKWYNRSLEVAILLLPIYTNSFFPVSPSPILSLLPRWLWGEKADDIWEET